MRVACDTQSPTSWLVPRPVSLGGNTVFRVRPPFCVTAAAGEGPGEMVVVGSSGLRAFLFYELGTLPRGRVVSWLMLKGPVSKDDPVAQCRDRQAYGST